MTPPVVLAIAATDSGGGAGLAADLATFAALGAHGACTVTAVTAQDTLGVRRIHRVPIEEVAAQLDTVLADLPVAVIKTGMLADPDVVRLVARRCAGLPIVVDPVLRSTTGAELASNAVVAAYREHLVPIATVVTPNAAEATVLGELEVPVVRTGSDRGVDILVRPGLADVTFAHAIVETDNDHGTGCTFSSALATYLARGLSLVEAVDHAGHFTAQQLGVSQAWNLGRGRGPIAHTLPMRVTTSGGIR